MDDKTPSQQIFVALMHKHNHAQLIHIIQLLLLWLIKFVSIVVAREFAGECILQNWDFLIRLGP